ncbi:hypothetical protein SAMN05428977_104628 [Nitrosomonas sp. Nm166]|nr:hypothetical protein SAMN05428977_104628 [Nitrosomonas sp. Nm166]
MLDSHLLGVDLFIGQILKNTHANDLLIKFALSLLILKGERYEYGK